MRLGRFKKRHHEDVVATSLSEIVLFFLFFCLILLGSVWATEGLLAEQYSAACGEDPEKCVGIEQFAHLIEKCGKDGDECVERSEHDSVSAALKIFNKLCDGTPDKCVGLPRYSLVKNELDNFISLCGPTTEGCVPEEDYRNLKGLLQRFIERCGNAPDDCREISQHNSVRNDLDEFIFLCGTTVDGCVSLEDHRNLEKRLQEFVDLCGNDRTGCVPKAEAGKADVELGKYKTNCGPDPAQCIPRVNQPTSLFLTDKDGYTFQRSESSISSDFRRTFISGWSLDGKRRVAGRTAVINEIKKITKNGAQAVIEVIGHTDGLPYKSGGKWKCTSDLDHNLVPYLNQHLTRGLNKKKKSLSLRACDNAGLGLSRAAITANFLRNQLGGEYSTVPIVPYSAGQLQPTTYKIAARQRNVDNRDLRRIEIRVSSRLKKE